MAYREDHFDWAEDIKGLTAHVAGELLAITADGADHPTWDWVPALLQDGQNLGTDVVYVARLVHGRIPLESLDIAGNLAPDPLEELYGRKVLDARRTDGRIPQRKGATPAPVRRRGFERYIAIPVLVKGRLCGTVCCRSEQGQHGDAHDAETSSAWTVAKVLGELAP